MAKTIAGLFESLSDAEHVIRDLRQHGFDPDNIGFILPVKAGIHPQSDAEIREAKRVAAAGRAVAGGAIGGIAGVLAVAASLAFPASLTLSPATAILTGGALGAIGGGIIGALKNPNSERERKQASTYTTAVTATGRREIPCWVAVNSDERRVQQAVSILREHQAIDITQRLPAEIIPAHAAGKPFEPSVVRVGTRISHYETMTGRR